MARIIDDASVEPVTRVLLGAIDVGDGGTDEQRADLDIDALSALDPDEAAAAVGDPSHRRHVRELMALLESCRHPLTGAQVDRVERTPRRCTRTDRTWSSSAT